MAERPLDFVQFDVIYTRQGDSNKWTKRIERKEDPIKTDAKGIISFHTSHVEGETVKDEKRINYKVNVKCDPLYNDPNTLMIPENWRPYEEEAFTLTDNKFKERHPEAEFSPLP